MKAKTIKEILHERSIDSTVIVQGWVRTKRESKNIMFLEVYDGSSANNLQIVAQKNLDNFESELRKVTTGASLRVEGVLVASQGKQDVEIQATKISIFCLADPETYPLQKKEMSMEYLRSVAHFRPRTQLFSSIFRIRSALAFAIHNFFREKGFFYIHTPIITGSDCEGAGEMFRVTTLPFDKTPRNKDGSVNFKEDFFGKETYLTVSGQLDGEMFALALGNIYTFGPTFRAENSNTTRHAAEFWMIEPEMAFYELEDLMQLEEEFVKYLISYILDNCKEDLLYLDQQSENTLIAKLQSVCENAFARVSYEDALKILDEAQKSGKVTFDVAASWDVEIATEHERYLAEKHFCKPVILYNFPKDFKAFYMYFNEDGKTVRGTDVLVPGIGEIIGGSEREWREDVLLSRIEAMNLKKEDYEWYLQTRRFGSVPHSGFGLGFERMVQFVTGIMNIRDVVPFARTPKNAEF